VYLRAHQNHIVIHKLRTNTSLTAADLAELERLLAASGIAKPEDIERAKADSQGLGLFVRSLVGMDRQAAKDALAGFLAGKTLAGNQIDFVNLSSTSPGTAPWSLPCSTNRPSPTSHHRGRKACSTPRRSTNRRPRHHPPHCDRRIAVATVTPTRGTARSISSRVAAGGHFR
jgi:hypothetical protein